jgi:hypothetical protein
MTREPDTGTAMPLFNSQIRRCEIATTVVVEVLVLLALGFAVVRYVEWSTDAAVAEFMSAAKPPASDPTFTSSGTLAPAGDQDDLKIIR